MCIWLRTSIFVVLLFFMKIAIPILMLFGLLISCGNSSEGDQEALPLDNSIIFGVKDYSFPELLPSVREHTIHWAVFEDFIAEARNINGSTYDALRNGSELLKMYSDSLFAKIPDTLDTNLIRSRLLVLQTRSAMLDQLAHQSTMDSLAIQNSIVEMNVAVENLTVQLNEKFRKDQIDFQRRDDEQNELQKQARFRDSVMDLERQDIKNKKV
ncbi:MAG TPA: hypothetical protein VKX40_07990 [Aequorivita sp.]|nr:hypothetical protein [Aequorivita sp.]